MIKITRDDAAKVLGTVDQGLSGGLGVPIPGRMCVEAAVCYALGLPHGDDPGCVAHAVRDLKIFLNDNEWSSNAARAKGLRRLALAQLGSKGAVNDHEFVLNVCDLVARRVVPLALHSVAHAMRNRGDHDLAADFLAIAHDCATKGVTALPEARRKCDAHYKNSTTYNPVLAYAVMVVAYADSARAMAGDSRNTSAAVDSANYAANCAANAYAFAARKSRNAGLAGFAEGIVQILIHMKAPGCQWLDLAPAV